MVDLFEEVEESLRADKLKAAGRRVLPWVLGLTFGVVVVGGGFLGWKAWTNNATQKASEAYDAIIRGEVADNPEDAYKAFGDIAARAPAGYKTLALMNQASIRMDEGREKDAIALLDKAADAAPGGKAGAVLKDAARLKAALAVLDDAPYADVEARLKPLTEDGRPYRAMAREALAVAKLNAGKTKEAREDFLVLSADLTAPPTIAERAKGAITLIDNGLAGTVPQAVKAAKAMPPPQQQMQLPPELLEQLKGMKIEGAPAQ